MKYSEVFRNSVFALAIPLENLEKKAGSSVLFMRYEYEQAMEEFNKKLQGALKVLKKDDFDAKLQKLEKVKSIEGRIEAAEKWNGEGEEPTKVSDEEKTDMETLKAELGDFESGEYADYLEKSKDAYDKLMDSECPTSISKLTREQYTEVYGAVGINGNMEGLKYTMTQEPFPKEEFLMCVLRFLVA